MRTTDPTPYSKDIENFVKKYALSGKNITNIFELAKEQGFQNMPSSRTTFSKLYKHIVDKIKADKIVQVADKVYANAIGRDENDPGCFKSQELILTTQSGWVKTNVNVDVVVDEEDNSARIALLEALGISPDDVGKESKQED